MTMWSDSRNHLLDDLLRDTLLVFVAQAIGVAPGQFIAIVALTQLSENLHHANLRLGFGALGDRLWVSPRFHRLHHAIGDGGATAAEARVPPGCNFGVLLPWWDMLFGTANFDRRYEPTGVSDQVRPGPDGRLRDYGRGFWRQQWRGLLRLAGRA
jgi:sterol desaturase/sphingolipid hydroxylase (fatty acid hydroxylase superfamily)